MKKCAFLFMAAALLAAGCSSRGSDRESVRRVKTDTVRICGQNRSATFPGKVKASSDVGLAFRVGGTIARVNVEAGDFIRKGQVLAELDPRDYQTQLAATEAKYRQVKSEAERIIGLHEKGSVAPNDYDKAVYGLEQITALYDAHKNALADTKLRAPFDGYIQRKLFDRNETVAAGMPVISIISSGRPEVEINLPAGDFMKRSMFDSYTCTVDMFPGQTFDLEPAGITPKANLNQLYTMRLRFRDVDGARMPPAGMAAMVTINYKPAGEEKITLPVTAMFEREGASAVWVYDPVSETVSARGITLHEIKTDGDIVVSAGLCDGDVVVTAGANSLSEGEKVKLLERASETNVGGML